MKKLAQKHFIFRHIHIPHFYKCNFCCGFIQYEGIELGFAPNFKWDVTAYTANVYRDLQGSYSYHRAFLQLSSIDIAGKSYGNPVNPL